MEGDSGNEDMSELRETSETLVHPTDSSDCLAANYVSSHYDVHICMRTGGHVITTPHAGAVCGKIRVDHLDRGLLTAASRRSPQKCAQEANISVFFCVASCVTLLHCDSLIFEREYRALLTFWGGCMHP